MAADLVRELQLFFSLCFLKLTLAYHVPSFIAWHLRFKIADVVGADDFGIQLRFGVSGRLRRSHLILVEDYQNVLIGLILWYFVLNR